MPWFPPRVPLLLGLLLAPAAACAHPRPATTPRDPSTVTAEEIRRTPGDPIEQLLAGKVSGVTVTRTPDGELSVRIRGGSSIHGSNEPLYVIDGFAIEAGPNGSLGGLNPYDIERIQVLKDAASTTMYGLRGANGVILITTKRPPQ